MKKRYTYKKIGQERIMNTKLLRGRGERYKKIEKEREKDRQKWKERESEIGEIDTEMER